MPLTTVRKLTLGVTAAALAAASASASAFTKPPFPRIGGINIGSPMNFNDSTYQAQLAKQHIMILGNYPGIAPGGQSMNAAVQGIKAKNPNALVFLYSILDSVITGSGTDAYNTQRAKIDSMKWWVYTSSAMTSPAMEPQEPNFAEINVTSWAPKDSSGMNAVDWIANYFTNTY